jgi:hypothetical protein
MISIPNFVEISIMVSLRVTIEKCIIKSPIFLQYGIKTKIHN